MVEKDKYYDTSLAVSEDPEGENCHKGDEHLTNSGHTSREVDNATYYGDDGHYEKKSNHYNENTDDNKESSDGVYYEKSQQYDDSHHNVSEVDKGYYNQGSRRYYEGSHHDDHHRTRHSRSRREKRSAHSPVKSFGSSFDSADSYSTVSTVDDRRARKKILKKNAEEDDVYIVRQSHGYFAILFSISQVVVLGCMMWQCGIAPMNINPMFGPYPDALSYWGGKNAVLIIEDEEYWRLMSPIFLHAGVIHLICNVNVQLETGAFFEREWGSMTWLIVYLVSALGSSVLSCDSMPDSISVGSSGAVMGLFGAKLSEIFCRACESRRTSQEQIAYEVRMDQLGGVLCSLALVGLFSFIPYVDWAAHLGGLLAGTAIGLVIFSAKIKSLFWAIMWSVTGLVLTLVGFAVAIDYMLKYVEPAEELRDVCNYYQQYFDDYECHCQLEDYNDGE